MRTETSFFIQLFTYDGETRDKTAKTEDERKLKDGQVVAVLLPMSDVDYIPVQVNCYAITNDEGITVAKRHLIIKGEPVILTYPQKSGLTYLQMNSEKIELTKIYLRENQNGLFLQDEKIT